MNCSSLQHYLSAYHDDELAPDERAEVEAHLESCEHCAAKLAAFREISRVAAELHDPAAPLGMWEEIQAKLQRERRTPYGWRNAAGSLAPRRLLATAALVFVAIAAALGIWRYSSDEHRQMGIAFNRFLEEFNANPAAAQRILLAKYEGRQVSTAEAAHELRYHPRLPAQGPTLQLEGMYVLQMPCCKCVESLYRQQDGTTLAVFEHDDEEPAWFSERPAIRAHCNGVPAHLVQVDNRLAATWKCGQRYLTLVGARDLNQVAELMHCFEGSPAHSSQAR
ncbi:MAG: zf-HC2 domain-containing protein [Pirellulales bacterium]|nr:zf-HC2 domain-containing protein [Pirellulales bacterium]